MDQSKNGWLRSNDNAQCSSCLGCVDVAWHNPSNSSNHMGSAGSCDGLPHRECTTTVRMRMLYLQKRWIYMSEL